MKAIKVTLGGTTVATIEDAGAFGYRVCSTGDAVRRGLITQIHSTASSVARARAYAREAMRKAMLVAAARSSDTPDTQPLTSR